MALIFVWCFSAVASD